MVITSPTRITIEVMPMQPAEGGQGQGGTAPVAQVVVATVDPASEAPRPAAYEPSPCHCLDEEDCTADHEHE